jgi:hypothetical protein
MSSVRSALVAAATAGLLAAAPAAAQTGPASDHRLYVSGNAGASVYDVDCRGSTHCDRVDRSLRAALGFFVAPNLALEATFIDFGRAFASRGPDRQDWRVRLAGVGLAIPLDFGGPWSGLLRAGVASVRTASDRTGVTLTSLSGHTAEGYLGIAVAYALNSRLALELAFDSSRGSVDGTGGRVDALSFGVQLRF